MGQVRDIKHNQGHRDKWSTINFTILKPPMFTLILEEQIRHQHFILIQLLLLGESPFSYIRNSIENRRRETFLWNYTFVVFLSTMCPWRCFPRCQLWGCSGRSSCNPTSAPSWVIFPVIWLAFSVKAARRDSRSASQLSVRGRGF